MNKIIRFLKKLNRKSTTKVNWLNKDKSYLGI